VIVFSNLNVELVLLLILNVNKDDDNIMTNNLVDYKENKLVTICLSDYDDLRMKYDKNIFPIYGIFINIDRINNFITNNISKRFNKEIKSLVMLIHKIENNYEFDKHALFTIHLTDNVICIGRKWDTISDNETGLEFKTYVKENLEKLFDIKFEI